MRYIVLAVCDSVLIIKADMRRKNAAHGNYGTRQLISERITHPLELLGSGRLLFVYPYIEVERGEVARCKVNNINAV